MANNQLTIRDFIAAPQVQKRMADMFTDKRLMDNFVQSVISIAGSDELLAVAEPRSVFNACLTAASLNLPINKNLGFAHIIGYKNNKKGITEAQFQLGARGFKELAQRSGQYLIINTGDVREGELKGRDRLTGELSFNWQEDDGIRNNLPVVGYFSYFKLKNGFSSTLYMSLEEVQAHGTKYSQSFKRGYGPWVDNFDAMALKTVSKLNISKNGPLSIELQRAIETDQAVIHDEGNDYIDGTDLASVKADETTKAAIIEANTEDSTEPTEAEADQTPAQDPPAKAERVELETKKKPGRPAKKLDVKAEAARRGWTRNGDSNPISKEEVANFRNPEAQGDDSSV